MKYYGTLSEAIEDLKKRGYQEDFNIKPHCIECPSLSLELHPENFIVDEFHRFEGMSNTDDNSSSSPFPPMMESKARWWMLMEFTQTVLRNQ